MVCTEMPQGNTWRFISDVIANALNSDPPDIRARLEEILNSSGTHLAVDRVCSLWLPQQERQSALIHEWYAPGLDRCPHKLLTLVRPSISKWSEYLNSHGTLIITDTANTMVQAAEEIALLGNKETKSALACEMSTDSHGVGLICFQSICRQRAWSSQDIRTVELIADILRSVLPRWHMEQVLRASENCLTQSQRLARLGHYSFDATTFCWTSSPALDAIFGIEHGYERTFEGWLRIVHPSFREAMTRYFRESVLGQRRKFDKEYKIIAVATGEEKWVHGLGHLVLDDKQQVREMFGTIQDITARKIAEEHCLLAASVFQHAHEGIVITEADGRIFEINTAFSRITGFSRDEAVGNLLSIVGPDPPSTAFDSHMWRQLSTRGHWTGEVWNRHKNGCRYPTLVTISAISDARAENQRYVALFTDISEQKQEELRFKYIAHHDSLTKLPNRRLLDDRLRHAMAQAQQRQRSIVVGYLDIDDFKVVNDSHGHGVGDELLALLAARFQTALREGDMIARLGGDEFVIVVSNLDKPSEIEPIMGRLLSAAANPIRIRDLDISVSVSIGITFYPQEDDVTVQQLLSQADEALYRVKLSGKNNYRAYQDKHPRAAGSNAGKIAQARRALEKNEFKLYYQPQVNMRTGEILAVEALLRWELPDHVVLLPAAFLPDLADHRVAIDLDRWVLKSAATQLASWHAEGVKIPVSVNIGAGMLQDPAFETCLTDLISAYPLIAEGWLQVEVVERSALKDLVYASAVMNRCRQRGFRFSLDDFGTGWASLTHLKRLPVDQLKIDCSFVRNILYDPDDLSILEAILGLAATFRLEVIAEGVESEEHGRLLVQLGCEVGQGFGIAAAMPGEALASWTGSWKPPRAWTNAERLGENAVALLHARAEIGAWSRAMDALAVGMPASPPSADFQTCRFGKWLTAQGPGTLRTQAAVRTARRLHREFHDIAEELLSLHGGGRYEELQARLIEFHAHRDRLLRTVDGFVEASRAELNIRKAQ